MSDSSSSSEGNNPAPAFDVAFSRPSNSFSIGFISGIFCTTSGCSPTNARKVVIASRLRRANSTCTAWFARPTVSGPRNPMTSTMTSARQSAVSARGKNGRPGPNRQTSPNAPASSRLQPRTRLKNEPGIADWAITQAARPTQRTASQKRPPAHHPTRQQAASAGRSSNSVSSTGSRARSGGKWGRKRNAASERRSFPHPRSVGAGDVTSLMLSLQSPRVREDRDVPCALDRGAQLTLMPRAHAAQAARQDLAVVGDEAAEGALVLVVDETDPALAERAGLGWASHGLLLLVVVVLAPLLRESELLFGHRRGADFILEEREQVAHDTAVELQRALVLGDARGLRFEAGDDVVAV